MSKVGVLLVNLGTPNSLSVKDIKNFLTEFLMDERIMDFSYIKRTLLVKGIIVPNRYKISTESYKKIWDKDRGSPLMFHTVDLSKKVQDLLGENYIVEVAMRYQNPTIESALLRLQQQQVNEIIVLPLFPQYSSACNGSVIQKVQEITNKWLTLPKLKYINHFYDNELYINAVVEQAQPFSINDFDHVLFSYHGLPERQVINSDVSKKHCLKTADCCSMITDINQNCYRAQCFATSRKVAEKLNIEPSKYTTTFQSRLGKEVWLQPYSLGTLTQLAKEGKKKILVFSPAFVADCLETLYEVGIEYQEVIEQNGGEKVQLVPSLNSSDLWANAVIDIIKKA